MEAAHTEGDNSGVVPTDTMRNTVYGLAQDHLGRDLEAFGVVLCDHFLDKEWVHRAEVTIHEHTWSLKTPTGFIGGSSERRKARVVLGSESPTATSI